MSFINEDVKAEKQLQIKFTQEQKKELEDLAKSRNMKMSALVKTLLQLEKDYGVIELFKTKK